MVILVIVLACGRTIYAGRACTGVLGEFAPLCIASPSRDNYEHEYEPRLMPEDEDDDYKDD